VEVEVWESALGGKVRVWMWVWRIVSCAGAIERASIRLARGEDRRIAQFSVSFHFHCHGNNLFQSRHSL
jgi:hypothetical protein